MRIWLQGIRPAVTWPENQKFQYGRILSVPFIIPYPWEPV